MVPVLLFSVASLNAIWAYVRRDRVIFELRVDSHGVEWRRRNEAPVAIQFKDVKSVECWNSMPASELEHLWFYGSDGSVKKLDRVMMEPEDFEAVCFYLWRRFPGSYKNNRRPELDRGPLEQPSATQQPDRR